MRDETVRQAGNAYAIIMAACVVAFVLYRAATDGPGYLLSVGDPFNIVWVVSLAILFSPAIYLWRLADKMLGDEMERRAK